MNTSPAGAAGTGANQTTPHARPTYREVLPRGTRRVAAPFSVAVVAVASGAQAQDVTCQGKPATVVGPTEGAIDTNGTAGDDVIVAPIGPYGTVQGLGGNDLICLVNGLQSTLPEQSVVSVQAGAGNDSVVNEAVLYPGSVIVELGTGADPTSVPTTRETVYGADRPEPPRGDTEIGRHRDPRRAIDWITSGVAGGR